MGTKCAPCYANIFMGKFEETFIYLTVKDLHGCYLRYIDLIFMIWTGSKERFENFNQEISSCHPTIKFDYEIHHKEECRMVIMKFTMRQYSQILLEN